MEKGVKLTIGKHVMYLFVIVTCTCSVNGISYSVRNRNTHTKKDTVENKRIIPESVSPALFNYCQTARSYQWQPTVMRNGIKQWLLKTVIIWHNVMKQWCHYQTMSLDSDVIIKHNVLKYQTQCHEAVTSLLDTMSLISDVIISTMTQ